MRLVFVVSFTNGGWWWHLAEAPHGTILAHSDHGYASEDECHRAIDVIRSGAAGAAVQLRSRERNDHP